MKNKLLVKNIKHLVSCDNQDTVYNNINLYIEDGVIKYMNIKTKEDKILFGGMVSQQED